MDNLLDEQAVRHIAHLARLKVSDNEVAMMAGQLSNILEYVRQLNQLDTSSVEPTAHALALSNVFREDVVRASWTQDQAMANAPQHQDSFFKLPKVLDQESA